MALVSTRWKAAATQEFLSDHVFSVPLGPPPREWNPAGSHGHSVFEETKLFSSLSAHEFSPLCAREAPAPLGER